MLGYPGRYPTPSSTVTVSSPVSSATLSSSVRIVTFTEFAPAGSVTDVGISPVVYAAAGLYPRLTVSSGPEYGRDNRSSTGSPSKTLPEEIKMILTSGRSSSRTVTLAVSGPPME